MKRLWDLMVWTGGIALIAACLLNVAAVIGRHTGLPLRGAIELVQVAVLVSGSLALVAATARRAHAQVHFMLDRMPAHIRPLADRACIALTMVFFAALLGGAAWLSADLWHAQEVSELVGVPWAALRLFANGAMVVVLAILARQLVERKG
ncbi:TRAP transporter small permease subunit [Novosphingobium sp. FSY-8]|uniref:TRAP transporter small permease protein n=1 Tax=Novosphingobium ovatum TaxID=1908523 RepID=A0ABW9XCA3_9SPHN|nr:TRAP transporter small permease subunit [Novosphingobium ovatum]NBC36169.1 TRAP transporter small permease subunit [Novosphingobium ovatum]